MATKTGRLCAGSFPFARDGAFLLDQNDTGPSATLSAAVEPLCSSEEKFLASSGGELSGVRRQATNHGTRARRAGRGRAFQSRPFGPYLSPGQRTRTWRRGNTKGRVAADDKGGDLRVVLDRTPSSVA